MLYIVFESLKALYIIPTQIYTSSSSISYTHFYVNMINLFVLYSLYIVYWVQVFLLVYNLFKETVIVNSWYRIEVAGHFLLPIHVSCSIVFLYNLIGLHEVKAIHFVLLSLSNTFINTFKDIYDTNIHYPMYLSPDQQIID